MAIPGSGGMLFSAFDTNFAPAVDGDSVAFAKITQGVFTWNLSGPTLTRVADQTTAIPGRGTTFAFFDKTDIENGKIVFQGGRGSGGSNGVYTNLGGSLRAVADDLSVLPGGGVFGTEGSVSRGHSIVNGKIQFYGLTGSSNYILLNENSPGSLSLVAKGGTTLVPGTAEPILSGFYDQAYNGDSNVFAATALTSGPGLFSDRGGSLHKVLGNGSFDGKSITNFSFVHGSYAGRSFAFRAIFSDGSSGIYLATARQAAPATATLHPFTSGGVRDDAPTGSPDLVTQQFISRSTGNNEHRALLDYDLLDYQGTHVGSAHLRGTISTNNFLDSGVRNIGIELFADDGVTNLADFAAPATDAGSVSYNPKIQATIDFDIDVTAAINGLLDSGARFGAVRFRALNDFAPSVLTPDDLPTLTILVPEPSGIVAVALLGASILLRRRGSARDACPLPGQ